MEKINLTLKELNNLKQLFNENYLIIKQIKEYEKKIYNNEMLLFLKDIRDTHKKNLLTIMKVLDEKERIF